MASEIQVEIEETPAETPPADKLNGQSDGKSAKIDVKNDDEPIQEVLTPDAGLEKLKKQLADEQAARQDAERRAQEAAEGEARARGDAQASQLDQLKIAITQTTQANDTLEAKYAEALAAQDFAAAAKINREMATNSARLLALENGKDRLEKAPKPTPRVPTDPVEQFVSNMSPQSAAWVRAHPEYVRDAKKNRQMIAAHELALSRDIKADTDEYFESIEETLRLKKAEAPRREDPTNDPENEIDPMADTAKPVQRKASPPAAPVSRSGNGTGGGQSNRITLTRAQVEAAQASGLTLEEYAKNVAALKKEGRLN